MLSRTVPPPGQNELTKRMLAEGYAPGDWPIPEGIWQCDVNNFAYSREYRYTPTWELPCGLLVKGFGQFWNECCVKGVYHCAENDNPLFRCPFPARKCGHRISGLPPGINCQGHRTDRQWTEEESLEKVEAEQNARYREGREILFRKYAGNPEDTRCICLTEQPGENVDDARIKGEYMVRKCISYHCQNTRCVCRLGAERDLSPSNIYYDQYTEITWTRGLFEESEKRAVKDIKIFDRPIARTDAEICLKVWEHDPDHRMLPGAMINLDAARRSGKASDGRTEFFINRHGELGDGRENMRLTTEIRNIRVGPARAARDILQDLEDVRSGVEVIHESDRIAAAKAEKTERRQAAKVEKAAKLYAKAGTASQKHFAMLPYLDDAKDKEDARRKKAMMREAIRSRAEEIERKEAEKRGKAEAKGTQMDFFSELK